MKRPVFMVLMATSSCLGCHHQAISHKSKNRKISELFLILWLLIICNVYVNGIPYKLMILHCVYRIFKFL